MTARWLFCSIVFLWWCLAELAHLTNGTGILATKVHRIDPFRLPSWAFVRCLQSKDNIETGFLRRQAATSLELQLPISYHASDFLIFLLPNLSSYNSNYLLHYIRSFQFLSMYLLISLCSCRLLKALVGSCDRWNPIVELTWSRILASRVFKIRTLRAQSSTHLSSFSILGR